MPVIRALVMSSTAGSFGPVGNFKRARLRTELTSPLRHEREHKPWYVWVKGITASALLKRRNLENHLVRLRPNQQPGAARLPIKFRTVRPLWRLLGLRCRFGWPGVADQRMVLPGRSR